MKAKGLPGHIAAFKRHVQTHLKQVDGVLVLADARAPMVTINLMERLLKGQKPTLMVLGKADLADPKITKKWTTYLKNHSEGILAMSIQHPQFIRKLTRFVNQKGHAFKRRTKGPLKLMVMGLPNVGKSTIINRINKKNVAKAEDRPGVTKKVQWIVVNPDLIILDTPGVLMDQKALDQDRTVLQLIRAYPYHEQDIDTCCEAIFQILRCDYPHFIDENSEETDIRTANDWIKHIAIKYHFYLKGQQEDLIRAARRIISTCIEGGFGRISFQIPEKDLCLETENRD